MTHDLTIIMAVYNTKPQYLREAVLSIRNQTVAGDSRFIVIDDGSTDLGTIECLGELVDICGIELHHIQHAGTPTALNKAHSLVTTTWVAVTGDDINLPNRFQLQLDYLKKHPETDVLGGQLQSFYDDDTKQTTVWQSSHLEIPKPPDNNTGFLVNHGCVIYRQEAVMAVGGYNTAWLRGQDVELWKRMFAAGYKFRNIQEVVYKWRRFR